MRLGAPLLLVLMAAPAAADPATAGNNHAYAWRPGQDGRRGGRRGRGDRGRPPCHGERGHGDGPSAPQLKDETGLPIRPADLRYPARFKNGAQAIDVYRTLVTGLDGTPMPSYAGVFEDPGA